MLLPRHALPEPSPSTAGQTPAGQTLGNLLDHGLGAPLDRFERFRHRCQTIEDPQTRAELDWMLDEEPMAFLSFAASTIALHGTATPALIRDLVRAGYPEGTALSVALWWLCGLCPPQVLLDVGLPPWLHRLDEARLRAARRRRERDDESVDSYLLEVELPGGPIGTLHAQVDFGYNGAVVHGFAADQSIAETMALFRAATKWRRENGLDVTSVSPFRALGTDRAALLLSGPLRNTVAGDAPISLMSPWPGIRSLMLFFVIDCGVG
ncbi:MAG: hypothetical protein ACR2QO_11395 [Acidimicrobiales bacterium]